MPYAIQRRGTKGEKQFLLVTDGKPGWTLAPDRATRWNQEAKALAVMVANTDVEDETRFIRRGDRPEVIEVEHPAPPASDNGEPQA